VVATVKGRATKVECGGVDDSIEGLQVLCLVWHLGFEGDEMK
jgi:hypothetical protein